MRMLQKATRFARTNANGSSRPWHAKRGVYRRGIAPDRRQSLPATSDLAVVAAGRSAFGRVFLTARAARPTVSAAITAITAVATVSPPAAAESAPTEATAKSKP